MGLQQGFIANGNIYPCRFVIIDTSVGQGGRVDQSGAGGVIFGVSQKDCRIAPILDSNGYAASAGEPIAVYDLNSECALEISATVTQGQLLKSDSNGEGTPVTTDKDIYGAVALQNGVAGDQIKVKVLFGYYEG
jgi:hypothetical protein